MNDWFLLALLSLTTYRLTRLVVTDDFPPVLWARDRLAGGWRPLTQAEANANPEHEGDKYVERVSWSPQWLADLLSCSWCASGWVALGVVAASDMFVSVPVPGLMWGAAWALSSILAAQDWS